MWKSFLLIFILGLFIFSCDDGGLQKVNDFDQGPLLKNVGNQIILPAYQSLAEQNHLLAVAVGALREAPAAASLADAQFQLKLARLAWQNCSAFQFGPAEDAGLLAELNIYPIDKNQIEQNITNGSYDLSTLSNSDAKGYQALAFLMYGDPEQDVDILSTLTEPRLEYLETVAHRIDQASQTVYDAWKEGGGDYVSTFSSEASLGVDLGSSVGKLVNALNQDFERNTRDGKVGIPVGIRSLGETIPTASEAYFGGYSIELLKENIAGYRNLFSGGQGVGFDDYLEGIGAATTGNEDLALTISNQFDQLELAIDQIADPLPMAIADQKSDVEQVFVQMQILVSLFKVDMASSIGVIISYQDNDGD